MPVVKKFEVEVGVAIDVIVDTGGGQFVPQFTVKFSGRTLGSVFYSESDGYWYARAAGAWRGTDQRVMADSKLTDATYKKAAAQGAQVLLDDVIELGLKHGG